MAQHGVLRIPAVSTVLHHTKNGEGRVKGRVDRGGRLLHWKIQKIQNFNSHPLLGKGRVGGWGWITAPASQTEDVPPPPYFASLHAKGEKGGVTRPVICGACDGLKTLLSTPATRALHSLPPPFSCMPILPPAPFPPPPGVGAAITQYARDKGIDLIVVGNRRRKEGLSSVPTHM